MSPSQERWYQLIHDIALALRARNNENVESNPEYAFLKKLTNAQVLDLHKTIGEFRMTLERTLGRVAVVDPSRAMNTASTGLHKLLQSYKLLAMLNDEMAKSQIARDAYGDPEC